MKISDRDSEKLVSRGLHGLLVATRLANIAVQNGVLVLLTSVI